MRVRVLLFAAARELAGADTFDVELSDSATVADLLARLLVEEPKLAALVERSRVAVNSEVVAPDTLIRPSAEVALIPPVSGG